MAALGSNMKGKRTKAEQPPKKSSAQAKKPKTQAKSKSAKAAASKVSAPKEVVATPAPEAAPEQPQTQTVLPEESQADLIELKNADIILEPSKRKKIRKIRVFLEGELTINNVEGFMQRIHPIFNNFDYVDFYLRKVTSLDLSFIQMLYHFQKSYGKKKKEVTIDAELSSDLKKIIVHAGFEELMFIPKLV